MSLPPRVAFAAAPRIPRQAEETASKLGSSALALTAKFGEDLVSPPSQEGRALVAILARPDVAFDVAVSLMEEVWPSLLRIVFVTTGHQQSDEAKHEAHGRAMELLEEAEREQAAFRFQIAGRGPAETQLAESCALLHSTLCQDWTATRAAAVRAYRKLGRQKEVAQQLEITQQAVSQMLRGARYRELAQVEANLRAWLQSPTRPGLWPLGRPKASSLVAS